MSKSNHPLATEAQLNEMTIADLAGYYNELTGSKVKKFSDKAAGIKRCLAAIADAAEFRKNPSAAAVAKEEVAAKPVKKGKTPRLGFKAYDLAPTAGGIKEHRPGTIQDKLIAVLSKGCKYENLGTATGTPQERGFRSDISRLNSKLGWGVRTDSEGNISIYK